MQHTKRSIAQLFAALKKAWPHAHCELVHHNDFQLLLAVVLSAQTTDKSVNLALAPLLAKNPQFSPADLVALGEQAFLQHIARIGLAPTKARHCLQIAALLLAKHGGHVPLVREDLEALPGVGRKTASVVLNVLCGLPTFPVDTHVERVCKRLGLVEAEANRLQVEAAVVPLIPKKYAVEAHQLLIFHGRYLCKARNPGCEVCPVRSLCAYVNG